MICSISVNPNKAHALSSAVVFSEKLKEKGVSVIWEDNVCNVGYPVYSKEELVEKGDIIVIFGGDGTILRLAKLCAQYGKPIFAINLGRIGFLADFEPSELDKAVEILVRGEYSIEERKLLLVECKGLQYIALNEAVLARGASTKMIDFKAAMDDQFIDRYFADGIIVSTPTGSTAYNLSAGGPIITPEVEALVLTPICSHSLHSRPIVFSDKSIISIQFTTPNAKANLSIDGQDIAEVCTDDIIVARAAEQKLKFIRANDLFFVNRLLDKLNSWGITHEEEK